MVDPRGKWAASWSQPRKRTWSGSRAGDRVPEGIQVHAVEAREAQLAHQKQVQGALVGHLADVNGDHGDMLARGCAVPNMHEHGRRNQQPRAAPVHEPWNGPVEPRHARHALSMATRKITITVPEELVESIKERVDPRGVSGYIAAAAAHQDAMDRLRELAERIEEEHGAVTNDDQQAALNRIAAMDSWHDKQRPHSDEAA